MPATDWSFKTALSCALFGAAILSNQALAADGTVNLTNYDSNNPLFYNDTSTRLPVVGSYVQVLGGPRGGVLQVLSSSTGQTIFTLTEPGFFDAGFAIVPGVPENSVASFRVRAWRGGSTFETATECASSLVYDQPTGTNPPLPGVPIPARSVMPSIAFPISSPFCIPEPSTLVLILLGGISFLLRRPGLSKPGNRSP